VPTPVYCGSRRFATNSSACGCKPWNLCCGIAGDKFDTQHLSNMDSLVRRLQRHPASPTGRDVSCRPAQNSPSEESTSPPCQRKKGLFEPDGLEGGQGVGRPTSRLHIQRPASRLAATTRISSRFLLSTIDPGKICPFSGRIRYCGFLTQCTRGSQHNGMRFASERDGGTLPESRPHAVQTGAGPPRSAAWGLFFHRMADSPAH
jgi:hypothetical protein